MSNSSSTYVPRSGSRMPIEVNRRREGGRQANQEREGSKEGWACVLMLCKVDSPMTQTGRKARNKMLNIGIAHPPSEANSSPGPTRSGDGNNVEQFGTAELNESLTVISILLPDGSTKSIESSTIVHNHFLWSTILRLVVFPYLKLC